MTRRPVCLITGASAGIGAACARLAADTYDLVLTWRTDDAGIKGVARDAEAAGAKVTTVQADVADPDDIARIYAALDQQHGRIDVLINNAGIVAPTARLTEIDHARLTRMMNVNVIGAMLVDRKSVV